MTKISSHDLGQQAAGQAGEFGKKAGGKLARKALAKGAKMLKKLVVNLVKKFVGAAVKSLVATLGVNGIAILLALLIFSAIIMSIPFSDWLLGGGERTPEQERSDKQYEQKYKDLAEESVAPIDAEEADGTWKETLKRLVKPSWAIPASLIRYQLSRSETKYALPDAKQMFKSLEPSFSYKKVTDDLMYTKTITTCYHEETVYDENGNAEKDSNGNEVTTTVSDPPVESISTSPMPERLIMSGVSVPFGDSSIPSIKRYFPGGSYEPNGEWDNGGTSYGSCTVETYTRYEKTMIDDRGLPVMNFDDKKFKDYLISRGVKEKNIDEIFEYIEATDPDFPLELYKGEYSQGGGDFSNADYTYTGGNVDGWVWPIAIDYYDVNSGFGARWGQFHYGVDLGGRAWRNAPILAAKAGLVIWAEPLTSYGNLVVIAHEDGLQTRYAHMSTITVRAGDQVTAGQQVGKQGETGQVTGPHLHFEVAIPNRNNPMARMAEAEKAFDPMIFLGPIREKMKGGGK